MRCDYCGCIVDVDEIRPAPDFTDKNVCKECWLETWQLVMRPLNQYLLSKLRRRYEDFLRKNQAESMRIIAEAAWRDDVKWADLIVSRGNKYKIYKPKEVCHVDHD
jgi:hypothetical protein